MDRAVRDVSVGSSLRCWLMRCTDDKVVFDIDRRNLAIRQFRRLWVVRIVWVASGRGDFKSSPVSSRKYRACGPSMSAPAGTDALRGTQVLWAAWEGVWKDIENSMNLD